MQTATSPVLCGVVLAAGAGTRRGEPKALAHGGAWLRQAVDLLLDGGCARVVVVLGAAADEARSLVPTDERVDAVVAADWADGVAASLRAGLARASGDAVVVTLVDLPGTPTSVVARVVGEVDRSALRQAVYGGRPGHPVVVGADHWRPLAAALHGDRGARPYLVEHGVDEVECGDLHHGEDVDTRSGPLTGPPPTPPAGA